MKGLQKSDLEAAKSPQPTFVDVFAGCGGLSLGLMQAGWKGIFAIEKDPFAFETLKANLVDDGTKFSYAWPKWLPKEPLGVDVVLSKYRDSLLKLRGKVDLLVGGPPCQGFSAAGRRDPNDPRNRLVSLYLELVELLEPKIVLIENVRGITSDFVDESSPDGKINYATWIQDCLRNNYNVSSRMLDTASFGVPQRRQRFFVIASRTANSPGDSRCPFELIEKGRLAFIRGKGIASTPVTSLSAISDFETARNGRKPSRDTKGFNEIVYKGPKTSYQKVMNAGVESPSDTRLARHNPIIENRFKKIIKLCHSDGRLNVSISRALRESLGLKKCALRVLDPDGLSPTITSMPDDLLHYSEPRTLTVRENARLQSFPDWFAFKGKYTSGGERRRKEVPRFTQVANAVPPLVAEAIGLALVSLLQSFGPKSRSKPSTASRHLRSS